MNFPIRIHGPATVKAGLSLLLLSGTVAGATGCRQDMHNQPKFVPLRGTALFADGRSARPQVEGTVARSQEDAGSYLETGLVQQQEGSAMPFPVTETLLARGEERYNIYCSPCHSRVGDGNGRIVQRGYYQAANFHTERLRQAPLGHFVRVAGQGWGAMPSFGAELEPTDRWAIAAYIRALQLSQHASLSDVESGHAARPLQEIAAETGIADPEATVHRAFKSSAKNPAAPASPAVAAAPAPAAAVKPEAVAVAVTPAALAGASGAKGVKPSAAAQAPASAPAKPAAAAGDAAAGKQVYAANCQVCHQANRAGIAPVFPSLVGIVPRVGVEHIKDVILNGVPTAKPPMPAFADKLSEDEVNNLMEFLKTAKD